MKKQGLISVIATVALQLTLGTAYVWSIFQTGVANSIFGGDHAAAGLTFSLLLAALALGSAIGGRIAHRYGTQRVVFIGGIILSAGFFIASFVSAELYWLLWLSYGLMGGTGMGFLYSTTIACVQKWYPHKRGLVTGIAVAALGFGGVLLTPVLELLIKAFGGEGVGEQGTFRVLSGLFLIMCTSGSFFIKDTPEGYMSDYHNSHASATRTAKSYSTGEVLKTPQLYLITFTLLLACMSGQMMMAFAKPIAVAKGLEATATVGVLAITLFNSIGRMVCGMASDKLGRMQTIVILLAGSAVLSLLVNIASGYWVYVLIACIGFFYGGFLSSFPALTADLFGPKHMAANYGIVLLGFGAGAIISTQIAGYYKNIAESDISLLFPAFQIASACAGAGIIMIFIVRAIMKRKTEPSS